MKIAPARGTVLLLLLGATQLRSADPTDPKPAYGGDKLVRPGGYWEWVYLSQMGRASPSISGGHGTGAPTSDLWERAAAQAAEEESEPDSRPRRTVRNAAASSSLPTWLLRNWRRMRKAPSSASKSKTNG